MIKAYALNERGKIELTLEELQKLIDEAVEEGRRLAEQPTIFYRQCPCQTQPVTITTTWGDTPPFTSPFTCQTGSGRATSDFSYVTVPQNITGKKTFAAGEKNAREAIDEIKRQVEMKTVVTKAEVE